MPRHKIEIKTSIIDIIDYWNNIDKEWSNFAVDKSNAHNHCWRCSYQRKLQQCHLIARSLNGEDNPNNFVLLCDTCHKLAPNLADGKYMLEWIKAYSTFDLRTLKYMQVYNEYEFIYKENLLEVFKELNMNHVDLQKFFKGKLKYSTTHFGNSGLNLATHVGLIRKYIEEERVKKRI